MTIITFSGKQYSGKDTAAKILMDIIDDENLPIAVTNQIGHRADSKAVFIGKELVI